MIMSPAITAINLVVTLCPEISLNFSGRLERRQLFVNVICRDRQFLPFTSNLDSSRARNATMRSGSMHP